MAKYIKIDHRLVNADSVSFYETADNGKILKIFFGDKYSLPIIVDVDYHDDIALWMELRKAVTSMADIYTFRTSEDHGKAINLQYHDKCW